MTLLEWARAELAHREGLKLPNLYQEEIARLRQVVKLAEVADIVLHHQHRFAMTDADIVKMIREAVSE